LVKALESPCNLGPGTHFNRPLSLVARLQQCLPKSSRQVWGQSMHPLYKAMSGSGYEGLSFKTGQASSS